MDNTTHNGGDRVLVLELNGKTMKGCDRQARKALLRLGLADYRLASVRVKSYLVKDAKRGPE